MTINVDDNVIDAEAKRRIERQAAAYMTQVFRDGDWTEALASFYAAAQVIEREMILRSHADPEWLLHIQLVGKRVGAAMKVAYEEEFVGTKDTQ